MPKQKLLDKDFKWSPELAYAIGLITTDGCLVNDGRHIAMRSSDKDLLAVFKKCLGISNKIAETKWNGWAKKPAYVVQFGSVQFYRWLLKIGLTPAKTYTIGELKIPDKYFRDFLRGHIDGDGSIYTYMDYYNTFKNPKYIYRRFYTKLTSASPEHTKWLQRKIIQLTSLKGALECRKSKRTKRVDMWELKFSKKEALKLLDWVYYRKELPCLKRKQLIFETFLKMNRVEKATKHAQ